MNMKHLIHLLIAVTTILFWQHPAAAHCDALSGPVVTDARLALQRGEITPVLKWIQAADESEIREAFAKTVAVRKTGDAAREIADRWFFETLVRVHRRGEGFPYEGLKPADYQMPQGLVVADEALVSGKLQPLDALLSRTTSTRLAALFREAREAREHAEESVEAGRRYTAAYAELMHFVEELDARPAPSEGGHHGH